MCSRMQVIVCEFLVVWPHPQASYDVSIMGNSLQGQASKTVI